MSRGTSTGRGRPASRPSPGPQCPALVDDLCAIYPVRPVFCRTHYVTSPADACRPQGDPARLEVPVESMRIFSKASEIGTKLRAFVENQGSDFMIGYRLCQTRT